MNHKPIISLNQIVGCISRDITHNGNEVSYGWGNEDALMKWLNAKNHKAVEEALGIGGNFRKYPLIWLVEGWRGQESGTRLHYTDVTFHIAVNSNVESLNENRIPQFSILYEVANDFLTKVVDSRARLQQDATRWTERANFSVSNRESHAIDIWDTLILQTDLIIDPYCLPADCGL